MSRRLFVFAAVAAALANMAAGAPSTDATPGKSAPNDVPNTDLSKQSGSLSDKLNKTNGVIRPEGAVDPKMQKAAPETGSTRVIPPPGSPGGPTDVQPK
jgi:hypothetical protein